MEGKNYINIGGEKILVKTEMVDIFKLKFYPDNPRILSKIKQNPEIKKNEKLIEEKLWDDDDTHKLCRSIEHHGGLINPIIVYDNYVLEGNTRLCCFRRLYAQNKEDKWKFIRCEVLLIKKLPKEKIDILLGNEHIIGKIEWNTYEKGCWMTKMLKEDDYGIDKIKEIVGNSEIWIKQQISAYEIMVKEKINDNKKFSHLVQLVSNDQIRQIEKNKDPKIKEKIIKAIKNDQFKTAHDIRKIPVVYEDKESRKRLFEYGESIEQIFYDLKSEHPTRGSPFIRVVEDLTQRASELTRKERAEIAEDIAQKDKIKRLACELKKLCSELKKEGLSKIDEKIRGIKILKIVGKAKEEDLKKLEREKENLEKEEFLE